MNERSRLLLFIISSLILAALIARDGKLLLLGMPFLVYIIFGVMQAPNEVRLVASRAFSSVSVPANQPVESRIVIENQGGDLVNLCLDDTLFPSMTIQEGQAQLHLSLAAGETTELKYVFRAARGVYSWSAIHACASDPFGLFDRECDIPAAGEIFVHPAPMHIHPMRIRPRFTLHSAGPNPSRLAGSGTDFWSVREYQAGDSLRRLNWRLAARHPRKLFTNEFEREEVADFGFILDARRLTSAGATEGALFEYSVSAAASLSDSCLKNGNRASLLILGDSLVSVFPGYGKNHLNVLMRNLARAKLGERVSFSSLEYFPARLFPARSLLVIFSTVDLRDLETYVRLRAFGYEVLLISPDPVDFTFRALPLTKVNRMAFRAARVERVIQLKHLMKLGVIVIDWQVAIPLETVLHETMQRLSHRRNI
jgi:uncharacterized protein (DUF58 family)